MKQIPVALIIYLAVAAQMSPAQTQQPTQQTSNAITSAPPESAAPTLTVVPDLVSKVEPEYPSLARQAHVEGNVALRIQIATDGHVEHIWVLTAHPLLAKAAIDAVEKWKYAAVPVAGTANVVVPFHLDGNAPTPAVAQRIIVKEADQAAKLTSAPAPVYPEQARAAGIEGDVVLKIIVGKDGHVQSVDVASGNPSLTDAAVEAAKARSYRVTLLNGERVEVSTLATVAFRLK